MSLSRSASFGSLGVASENSDDVPGLPMPAQAAGFNIQVDDNFADATVADHDRLAGLDQRPTLGADALEHVLARLVGVADSDASPPNPARPARPLTPSPILNSALSAKGLRRAQRIHQVAVGQHFVAQFAMRGGSIAKYLLHQLGRGRGEGLAVKLDLGFQVGRGLGRHAEPFVNLRALRKPFRSMGAVAFSTERVASSISVCPSRRACSNFPTCANISAPEAVQLAVLLLRREFECARRIGDGLLRIDISMALSAQPVSVPGGVRANISEMPPASMRTASRPSTIAIPMHTAPCEMR